MAKNGASIRPIRKEDDHEWFWKNLRESKDASGHEHDDKGLFSSSGGSSKSGTNDEPDDRTRGVTEETMNEVKKELAYHQKIHGYERQTFDRPDTEELSDPKRKKFEAAVEQILAEMPGDIDFVKTFDTPRSKGSGGHSTTHYHLERGNKGRDGKRRMFKLNVTAEHGGLTLYKDIGKEVRVPNGELTDETKAKIRKYIAYAWDER